MQAFNADHLVGECWPEHCGPKSSETKSDDPSVDCRVPRWEDLGRISFVCLCFWSLSQPLCRRSLNQCQEVWCLSSGKVWKGSELGPKQNERPCFLQSAKIKVNVYHSLVNATHFPFRYHPNHPSDISKEDFLDEISKTKLEEPTFFKVLSLLLRLHCFHCFDCFQNA